MNILTNENDPRKPFHMSLARKLAKDVLYGLTRKIKKAKDGGRELSAEEEEKFTMGKIYDGLIIAVNKDRE